VKGAIYEVTDVCLRKLDKWETGYARQNVTVFDEDNQPIQAVTYIKTGSWKRRCPPKNTVQLSARDTAIGASDIAFSIYSNQFIHGTYATIMLKCRYLRQNNE